MEKLRIYACLLPFFLFLSTHAQTDKSRVLQEIIVQGDGYERGLQHGKALKTEIGEVVKAWRTRAEEVRHMEADEVLSQFFEYAKFEEAIKEFTPDLYDEICGIAEGSGQDFNSIFILNLIDEYWVYLDSIRLHHCTGLGVPARDGKPGYIAQNMDIPPYLHPHKVIMRISGGLNRPEQLILTYPGLIALNGLNSKGVGVCVNTLMQLKGSPEGIPVAFMIRGILERSQRSEVLDFLKQTPHASGQNYIVGIRGEVFDFEASCTQVVSYKPDNHHGTVYHSNHPLANQDIKFWYGRREHWSVNSKERFESVEKRMTGDQFPEESDIKSALRASDHVWNPVCHHSTFASVIMTFSDQPTMQVTAGRPDQTTYQLFEFN